jgi:high-affinity Fe2+/Pb2+ permease
MSSERYAGEDVVTMLREGNEIARQALDFAHQEQERAIKLEWVVFVVLAIVAALLGYIVLRGGL